jgi:ketosteroid isomerase-like protein
MSSENLEVVQAAMRAWEAGELALELFDPEVEWIAARSGIEGAFHGHAGLLEFRDDTLASFERFQPQLQLLDAGDRVVAWGTIHVRARDSGIEMDQPVAGVFELRDGRITRWRDLGSKERAFAAAGLGEPAG